MGDLTWQKACVVGATGPTGSFLAKMLRLQERPVRVVSRNAAHLDSLFEGLGVDVHEADILDAAATMEAVRGCDLVFDCIGLPGRLMQQHPVTARNIGQAVEQTGARCVHISSYWAYLPVASLPLSEQHPRAGGPPWVQVRRETEDIMLSAGAAVIHLPDFYGPHVHTSTLQQPLVSAFAGGKLNWIGPPDLAREYIYVPDAMRLAVALAGQKAAYGERWMFPGGGPLTARQVAETAAGYLEREIEIRSAGLWTLRGLSLFSRELRGFLQMVPYYLEPISYDSSKLEALLGPFQLTPYKEGIGSTLAWLAERS